MKRVPETHTQLEAPSLGCTFYGATHGHMADSNPAALPTCSSVCGPLHCATWPSTPEEDSGREQADVHTQAGFLRISWSLSGTICNSSTHCRLIGKSKWCSERSVSPDCDFWIWNMIGNRRTLMEYFPSGWFHWTQNLLHFLRARLMFGEGWYVTWSNRQSNTTFFWCPILYDSFSISLIFCQNWKCLF